MAVCINFNYPRVPPTQAATGASTQNCATKYGTTTTVTGGGAFTPLPFKAYQLLSTTGGLSTPTGRNVESEPQINGIVAGWPHFAKGIYVPGPPGDAGCGIYALFGQIP